MKNKPMKKIKKVFYRTRTNRFKRLIALLLIGGIVASVVYFTKYAYTDYAVSNAHVILSYPEIAHSGYPDGSRFIYYEFLGDDKLEDALEIMQKDGKYENLTVDDIKDQFDIYSYLNNSASAEVSSVRSAGNDFSYVANEYRIRFVQPHDYKNKDIIKKFIAPDYSDEFLRTLIEVNRTYIAEIKGGVNGFETLTETNYDNINYDYDEKVRTYRSKINAIITHLNTIEADAPEFVSGKHNMSIKDIKGKYEILLSNKLDGIDSFIISSGISKNAGIASNKLKVNIETNQVKYNKKSDEALINTMAMNAYDHTFTENLINVVRDDTQGLYQARPKTSFDTVVTQKNEALESVAELREIINVLNQDLARFSKEPENADEHNRLSEKCAVLLENFDKEYQELTKVAREVVSEFLNETNKSFIKASVTKKSIFSIALLSKLAAVFCIGAVLMFVLCVLGSVMTDDAMLKRKMKLVEEIKHLTTEKGA